MIFCFGVILRILNQIKLQSVNRYDLCDSICRVFNSEMPYSIDSNKYEKLLNGKNDFPEEAATKARELEVSLVQKRIREYLFPKLDLSLANEAVLLIRDVLAQTEIPDSAIISSSKKESLLKDPVVHFDRFLSDVFLYVANHKNIGEKKTFAFIEGHPVESYRSVRDSITIVFENAISGSSMELTPTLDTERFGEVFREMPVFDVVSLPRQSHVRVFYLETRDMEFDYLNLVNYLKGIICQYVNSRQEIQENSSRIEDYSRLSIDALSALRKTGFGEKDLNDLMVYSFLECALKAPKILSRYEVVKEYSQDNPRTRGIHLLYIPIAPEGEKYQLVYGTGCTSGSLESTIEEAISELKSLRWHLGRERMFLSQTAISKLPYSDDLKVFFKNVICGRNPAQNAFGLFLGYTLNLGDAGYDTTEEYEAAKMGQLHKDIKKLISLLETKLQNENLVKGCSFYVYLLPLNNALEDPKHIVEQMME